LVNGGNVPGALPQGKEAPGSWVNAWAILDAGKEIEMDVLRDGLDIVARRKIHNPLHKILLSP
jgi:hypothetical protein